MTGLALEQVESGTRVFVDSSVLLYHFFRTSDQSRRFLRRCEERDCSGVTSVVVMLEVTHRLMAMEALASGLVPPGHAIRRLQERPDIVRRLSAYATQAAEIPAFGIEVLPADLGVCLRAADVRDRYGLLTNDSVIVATMRDAGVTAIATADRDFERVDGLQVFRPTDLDQASPALA
jgi:predicted nucleic acid-binding protein